MLKHIQRNGLTGSVVAVIGDDAVVFWDQKQVTPDLVQVRWVHQGFYIELTETGRYRVTGLEMTADSLRAAKVIVNRWVADRRAYA